MAKKSKGKAPKGRAGLKQRAQRDASGPHRGNSRGQRFAPDDDDDDDDYVSFNTFRGFSGSTQDRPRHDAFRDPSIRLRNQAISFVSAGANAGTVPPPVEPDVGLDGDEQDEEDEVDLDGAETDDDAIQTNIMTETDLGSSEVAMANMHIDSLALDALPPTSRLPGGLDGTVDEPDGASFFVVDTEGDANLAGHAPARGKPAVRRDASPARSDSSDEVVVFHGRNKPRVLDDPVQSSPGVATPSTSEARQSPAIQAAPVQPDAPAPDLLTTLAATLEAEQPSSANEWSTAESSSQPAGKGWAAFPSKYDRDVNLDATWAPAPAGSWWKKKNQLQADWTQALREKRADVIKLSSAKPKRRGTRGARKSDNRRLRNDDGGSNDDGHESGASEAAYMDYMENLKSNLDAEEVGDGSLPAFAAVNSAHNAVLAGPSMVVDGRAIADDEVINVQSSASSSDDDSDDMLIDQDLGDMSLDDDVDLSGLDDTELEDALEYSEQQQWEDEVDLRRRRADARTDEQLARLFAKQQELGIDDDDLVIEDGFFGDEDLAGVGDVAAARAGLANIANFDLVARPTKARKRTARSQGGPNFVDASMLADVVEQYGENGFDIMDFDRPSLRPTKKGRKGKLPPELEALSDEDLKQSMQQAWSNDRAKKQAKRAERDALRVQGLLGGVGSSRRTSQQPSLRDKYPRGITKAQVHEELRAFMLDDDATDRPFPPMGKQDRAELHLIAVALKLKSKSAGVGAARHPVLTKTRATRYAAATLDAALAASTRGWLGSRSGGLKKIARGGGGGGGGGAGASGLRNGEVVGAGAAEIGKENFGHRMMEKMGWSRGQALGKDGEGRLVPVEQVMRAGRAGLG